MAKKKVNPATLPEEDGPELREQFLAAEKIATQQCIGQTDMLRGMLLSILAKEHMILVGPHGCNKTRAINVLLAALNADNHGETFYATLDKSTPPEVLLGMFSPKALKDEDRWVRNMTRKLPEARFAFVGEVFRGNSIVRAALHTILNERYIENDGQRVACPLHTCFCDSNSYPCREEDFPFYDRILFRFHVGYLPSTNRDGFLKMLSVSETGDVAPVIERGGIQAAHDAVMQVTVPEEVCAALFELRADLLTNEIQLSDRRWHRALSALKASAWLRGDTEVALRDFVALHYVLWAEPEQRAILAEALAKFATRSPSEMDEDHMAEADKVFALCMEESGESELGDALVTLAEIASKLNDGEARAKVAVYISAIERLILGVDDEEEPDTGA